MDSFLSLSPKNQVATLLQTLPNFSNGLVSPSTELLPQDTLQMVTGFCEQHHPRLGPSSEALLSALADLNFLKATIYSLAFPHPQEFVVLIRLFSRIDGFERMMSSCNAISVLVDVLDNNLEDITIAENACIALGSLATHEQTRQGYAHSGAIATLVKMLDVHTQDTKMVQIACKSLVNACFKCNQNKTKFVEEEGFPKLIAIFGLPELNDLAKYNAAVLLRNICNLGNDRMTLIQNEETVMEDLLCALGIMIETAQVEIHLLWASLNLTVSWGRLKKEFGEKGGCVQILEVMRRHKDNEILQKLVCTVVKQLGKKSGNRLLFGKNNITTDLTDIMVRYKEKTDILQWALDALATLCSQAVIRKRMVYNNEIDVILNIMEEKASLRSVVLKALDVLHHLSCGARQTKAALIASNAIQILNKISKNYSDDTEVSTMCSECITSAQKKTDQEEEDSDHQSDSDDESDSISTSESSDEDDNKKDSDFVDSKGAPDMSLNALRALRDREEKVKKTSDTAKDDEEKTRLSQQLDQEIKTRKKLEEEIRSLKLKNRENEKKQMKNMELESINHQLNQELKEANRYIAELISQRESQRDHLKGLENQHRQDASAIREHERKGFTKEIDNYKQLLQEKDNTISHLRSNLFHYITLSIKLHHFAREETNSQFNQDEVFRKIEEENLPIEEWPNKILEDLQPDSALRKRSSSRSKKPNVPPMIRQPTPIPKPYVDNDKDSPNNKSDNKKKEEKK